MARAGRLLAPQRQSGVTTSPSQFGPWEYIDKCTKIGKNNYLTLGCLNRGREYFKPDPRLLLYYAQVQPHSEYRCHSKLGHLYPE
ncbi:hypothetical protein EVAR_47072_1 [Eumeta japonica]|uniref:Uncharacterized protein n=1 Tax=Eumeta variegata TaxID=151549 RepID=A0A4C1WP48_EUMVA|nr:hypothetical protein EVAR_47072_1 [Eumeta japonica]